MQKFTTYKVLFFVFLAIAITFATLYILKIYKDKKQNNGSIATKAKAIKVSDSSMTVKVAGSPTYLGEVSANAIQCEEGYVCVELSDGGYICKKVD